MKVGVVGAGAAGLCAARRVLSHLPGDTNLTVFESSDQIGGTWIYTDAIGRDQHGIPIHSSMYKNMRYRLLNNVRIFSS